MTFLAPALLALGLAVAIPLVLHLLQRDPGTRVVFPALRYLRRAEREHATRIRQVLLLAVRVLALLFLAAAAARPFVRGIGHDHPPTALVVVLDNSLSSGAVVGDRRVLDELREAALAALARIAPGDEVWLIRAGSPWEPAVTGSAATVAEAVRRTDVSAARGDLGAALRRALSILAPETSGRAREIHLLSDLQATGLPGADRLLAGGEIEGAPIVAYAPRAAAPENRAVAAVEVGGGLPPRADQRSTVAVTLSGAGTGADSVSIRLVIDGAVRAAGRARPGDAVVLPFPAHPAGRVTGHVEIDPDGLVADDRRYFVIEVATPMTVALPDGHAFLAEAVSVLEDAGRVRRAPPTEARVVLAPAGASVESVRRGATVVVMPPATPVELTAANQRLAAAGIPWRYGPPGTDEARVDTVGSNLAATLADVRLRQIFPLTGPDPDAVALRLRGGEPWAVHGAVPDGGRYLLLASPLTPEGGTIATSAAMVPFLDHVLTGWAVGAAMGPALAPGDVITLADDAIAGPEGVEPVRAGGLYRVRAPGVYHLLSGADTVAAHAVNPPPEESDLARIPPHRLGDRLPGLEVTVAGPGEWDDAIFRQRLGGEITPWLVLGALLLLLLEMSLSATGRTPRHRHGSVAAPVQTTARAR